MKICYNFVLSINTEVRGLLMSKKIWVAVRRSAFIVLLIGSVIWLGYCMKPRDGTNPEFSNTVTFREFYELKPNTVDVLFLGSSHGEFAFSPMELYSNYGLTGYNLCSGEQSIPLSYYWLLEALRTQQPKVVVLDCFFLFDYTGSPMNTPEPSVRRAIDPLRLSGVKLQAIREICELDQSYDPLSYFFPVVLYHEAWQDYDLKRVFAPKERGVMGYCPVFTAKMAGTELKPFERIHTEKVDMHPVMKNYLIRMAQLCKEKGIYLVLTKTPTITHFLERHNAIRAFAEEYGVDFIDFNESEVYYNGLDYWFETDNSDAEHTNYWGSAKVMDYLGEFFVSTYGLEAHEDSQWSDLETRYQEWIENGEEAALNRE